MDRKIVITINGKSYFTTVDESNRSVEGECQVCGGEFKHLLTWLEQIGVVQERK